jgi:hypothetical protein
VVCEMMTETEPLNSKAWLGVGKVSRPISSRSSLGSRTAKTKAPGSAMSRRATNARLCNEARSSHCASSTTQTSARSSATWGADSGSRDRSGTDPAPPSDRPKATRSASRCGPGRSSTRSRIGAHSCSLLPPTAEVRPRGVPRGPIAPADDDIMTEPASVTTSHASASRRARALAVPARSALGTHASALSSERTASVGGRSHACGAPQAGRSSAT